MIEALEAPASPVGPRLLWETAHDEWIGVIGEDFGPLAREALAELRGGQRRSLTLAAALRAVVHTSLELWSIQPVRLSKAGFVGRGR
ncbi:MULTISPECIES: hypothetical protein [Amycolatopsis]|uniref:Uncharacterized protein n=1 Tax=Amycolatopsis dendrobii TaxID=2760662 RepID=A0A7W3VXE7_9PSEU|nr:MULTISPECIES: hypothetical protein [Amycolatopsis]MBB1154870.1 hypothetical protein [Amycolatopsis dendrobii]UKD56316.1 hypothetical protein L3Q65_06255 [Amycolatopsis sp. FU40]